MCYYLHYCITFDNALPHAHNDAGTAAEDLQPTAAGVRQLGGVLIIPQLCMQKNDWLSVFFESYIRIYYWNYM